MKRKVLGFRAASAFLDKRLDVFRSHIAELIGAVGRGIENHLRNIPARSQSTVLAVNRRPKFARRNTSQVWNSLASNMPIKRKSRDA
ncbi:hypothetical protein [Rhizobium leguminosarum]|uniref:hypothetical protein n=1 Tax=Rhizobium leguminosarum TaxID=384 RepID=UPI0014413B1D|nr:hypothetical protein [Rhizobium leguminosarum]NKM95859.1 hypothetical protein [Rhizobium leguminosarum bv. viciae]